jgi:hypothetical protein
MNTLVKLAQLEATMLEVSRAIQIPRAAVADRADQEPLGARGKLPSRYIVSSL